MARLLLGYYSLLRHEKDTAYSLYASCMSREKCPQHIRFLGQAMAGGLSGAVLDAYDDHMNGARHK
jgi:hypothetical protein